MNIHLENNIINLKLPKDKFNKFNLTKYNINEFARILEAGIFIIEKGDQKMLSMSDENFNKKLENIEKQHTININKLKEENRMYEDRISNIEKVFIQEKNNALSRLKKSLCLEHNESTNNLKTK